MQLSSCSGNRITLIYPNISALGPQLQISLFLMGLEVKGSPFSVTILEEVDPRNCLVEGVARAVAGVMVVVLLLRLLLIMIQEIP